MSEKPLFIPLHTEYYNQFANGTKWAELRRYGKRWNEKTCEAGRAVVLSKGYGKQNRMAGSVAFFVKLHGTKFGLSDSQAILDTYGTLDIWIAVIWVTDLVSI